jgi:hypothetical protein
MSLALNDANIVVLLALYQYWRGLTALFSFTSTLSMGYHAFFTISYSYALELDSFYRNPADYLCLLIFGALTIMVRDNVVVKDTFVSFAVQ